MKYNKYFLLAFSLVSISCASAQNKSLSLRDQEITAEVATDRTISQDSSNNEITVKIPLVHIDDHQAGRDKAMCDRATVSAKRALENKGLQILGVSPHYKKERFTFYGELECNILMMNDVRSAVSSVEVSRGEVHIDEYNKDGVKSVCQAATRDVVGKLVQGGKVVLTINTHYSKPKFTFLGTASCEVVFLN